MISAAPIQTSADLKESALRRLAASRLRLSSSQPFFASLLLMTEISIADDVRTASTDGKRIFFNAGFVKDLSSREIDGVLIHEVLHCALLHVPRCGTRDPRLWNIAADIQINGKIRALCDVALPPGSVFRDDLASLRVEDIYDILRHEAHAGKQLRSPQLEDLADACVRRNSVSNTCGLPLDPKDAPMGTKPLSAIPLEDYWSAAMNIAHERAVSMGCERNPMTGLPYSVPQTAETDWRSELWRHVITSPDDFAGLDRRLISRRIYVETLECETIDLEVCIDTSGSISSGLLAEFTAEVLAIMESHPFVRCRLRWCDTTCSSPVDLCRGVALPKAIGGGGTDFTPFFNELEQDFRSNRSAHSVAIYFTDGFGVFPSRPPREHRVVWVVPPQGLPSSKFPFGDVVRLG